MSVLSGAARIPPTVKILDGLAPAGGGAVMGTGIVSIGLELAHQRVLSQILFAIAVLLWLGLAAAFLRRRLRQRKRWLEEARTPEALTAIAGTAVLGARAAATGSDWASWLLLAIALVAWIRLVPSVLRHWRTPTVGISFMLAVATESLAVVTALLGIHDRRSWLATAALALMLVGIAAYLFVLARVDLGQLTDGGGDQWVFGGALAIAALACARTSTALTATSDLAGLHGTIVDVTLALWAAAALWLPALLAAELISPRLRYDTRRWATVFPFGMYAVCSVATGSATGIGGIGSFGRVWIWVALAVWAIVMAGMLRRSRRLFSLRHRTSYNRGPDRN